MQSDRRRHNARDDAEHYDDEAGAEKYNMKTGRLQEHKGTIDEDALIHELGPLRMFTCIETETPACTLRSHRGRCTH